MSTPISSLNQESMMGPVAENNNNNVPNYQDLVNNSREHEPQQLGPPPPVVQHMPIHKNHDIRADIPSIPPPVVSNKQPEQFELSKTMQHEIMCIIASNFILYADPVQNILNTSLPNANKLLKILTRGIFIAIIFIILRKTTAQFVL